MRKYTLLLLVVALFVATSCGGGSTTSTSITTTAIATTTTTTAPTTTTSTVPPTTTEPSTTTTSTTTTTVPETTTTTIDWDNPVRSFPYNGEDPARLGMLYVGDHVLSSGDAVATTVGVAVEKYVVEDGNPLGDSYVIVFELDENYLEGGSSFRVAFDVSTGGNPDAYRFHIVRVKNANLLPYDKKACSFGVHTFCGPERSFDLDIEEETIGGIDAWEAFELNHAYAITFIRNGYSAMFIGTEFEYLYEYVVSLEMAGTSLIKMLSGELPKGEIEGRPYLVMTYRTCLYCES